MMGDTVRNLAVSSILGAMLLSGCASNPTRPVAVRLPVATPQPAPATRPVATINANLSPNEALWHMRSALNVAALSCRTKKAVDVAPAYNRLLVRHKAALALANSAEEAPFHARYGAKWAGPYDTHATRLYNFFAMPTAQAQFCIAAAQVLAKTNTMAPASLTSFAPAALAQLEAPFLMRRSIARR